MDIYFFDQKKQQRAKPTRKTLDDLRATRRERPQSAVTTRFKLDPSNKTVRGSDEYLSDLGTTPQISPRGKASAASSTEPSPRIPKFFDQLRSPRGALGVRFPSLAGGQVSLLGEDQRVDEEEDEEEEDPQKIAFQRAQFGAPNVLAQLTRILNSEAVEVQLPDGLVKVLSLGFEQLTYIGGEPDQHLHLRPRQWQTEAYRDMYLQRKQRMQEEAEEAERMMREGARSVGTVTSELSPRRRSARKSSTTTINDNASVITTATEDSRRQRKRSLERSRDSVISIGTAADASDIEQRVDVGGPGALRYRRESETPVYVVPLPPAAMLTPAAQRAHGAAAAGLTTRLEKFNKARARGGGRQFISRSSIPVARGEVLEMHGRPMTIHFSMLSSEAVEKGWIVHPQPEEELERETLLLWLKEHTKQTRAKRLEEEASTSSRGSNKPLEVRFYGDSSRQERARLAAMRRGQRKRVEQQQAGQGAMSDAADDLPFLTRLPDDSCFTYYPSGRVALCSCNFGPKNQLVYTYAYADDVAGSMLAMFLPSGIGYCYDRGGMIRVITDGEGGRIQTERGIVTRQWDWPDRDGRLQPTATYQLNDFITWRGMSLTNAVLHFCCEGEIAKFQVAGVSAEDKKILAKEAIGSMKLASQMHYTSHAASLASDGSDDRASTSQLKRKSKLKRRMSRAISQLDENHVASVLSQTPAVSGMREETAEPLSELKGIRRNIKSLVTQWMDHLRVASGMRMLSSTSRGSSSDCTPRHSASSLSLASRSSRSASGSGVFSRSGSSAAHSANYATSRRSNPSSAAAHSILPRHPPSMATAGYGGSVSGWVSPSQRQHARHQTYPLLTPSAVATDSHFAVGDYIAAKRQAVTQQPTASVDRSAGSSPSLARSFSTPPVELSLHSGRGRNVVCCPVSLRLHILQRLSSRPPCRCEKRHMPVVTDFEFDRFLAEHAPTQQLLIVNVSETMEARTTMFDVMLEDLYSQSTRARRIACQQMSSQPFRIVRYALASAADGTHNVRPLLQDRHHAAAGVCLMYHCGRLVFAGHTFNGYGNSKRDFMKQVRQTLNDAQQESYIAIDFKLNPSRQATAASVLVRPAQTPVFRLRPPSPEDVQMQGRLSSLNVEAASRIGSATDQSVVMSDIALTNSTWETTRLTLTKAQ